MMEVTLYTPESSRTFEAGALFLPGSYAPFEVLPGHAPIISTLGEGKVRWVSDGREESLDIRSGAVRVVSDKVEICAELL